jgi:SnoaL-like domain
MVANDDRLAQLADERALRRLVMRYAQACDRRDGAGFAALFAAGATLHGPGFSFAGAAAIGEVPSHLNRFKKTYHTLLNYTVDVNGDRAEGEAYSMAHHLTPLAEGEYTDLVMYITYRDRYVRSAGEWLFDAREVVMEFTERRIVQNPDTLPKV